MHVGCDIAHVELPWLWHRPLWASRRTMHVGCDIAHVDLSWLWHTPLWSSWLCTLGVTLPTLNCLCCDIDPCDPPDYPLWVRHCSRWPALVVTYSFVVLQIVHFGCDIAHVDLSWLWHSLLWSSRLSTLGVTLLTLTCLGCDIDLCDPPDYARWVWHCPRWTALVVTYTLVILQTMHIGCDIAHVELPWLRHSPLWSNRLCTLGVTLPTLNCHGCDIVVCDPTDYTLWVWHCSHWPGLVVT
jgi:hypothetical protein